MYRIQRIPARDVVSLVWSGDRLIDWAGGGAWWGLDGSAERSSMTPFGSRIDTAVGSSDGRVVVVHERLGTKGVVLVDGRVRREINRSYYCAEAYEYPIALAQVLGRTAFVHCPVDYDRLEIEDAVTGESLLPTCDRDPEDFFHSQLVANPSSTRFASAGWMWHPWDAVAWFDVHEALRDPATLDGGHFLANTRNVALAEQSDATWLDDARLLIATSDNTHNDAEGIAPAGPARLKPKSIGVYDVVSERMLATFEIGRPAGRMMALGSKHVVAFCGEPRIISLVDGRTVHVFEDLDGGDQVSAISGGRRRPTLALDPGHARFALVHAGAIHVVEVDVKALDTREANR